MKLEFYHRESGSLSLILPGSATHELHMTGEMEPKLTRFVTHLPIRGVCDWSVCMLPTVRLWEMVSANGNDAARRYLVAADSTFGSTYMVILA